MSRRTKHAADDIADDATPATAYLSARIAVLAEIERLRVALDEHAARAGRRPIDWSPVGDLAHIRCRLKELLPDHGLSTAYLPDGRLLRVAAPAG